MNECLLVNYSFDWRLVPLSAWASTGVPFEELEQIPIENRLNYVFYTIANTKLRKAEELVEFLAEHNHTSPFRHIHLTYLIKCDIATHIQCRTHRVGVEINSESARYKRLQDSFYVPRDLPDSVQERLAKHNQDSYELYLSIYQELIDKGYSKQRAKEASRYALPYSKQLVFVMTLSLQALAHFYQLRASEYAQLEIRELAEAMVSQLEATGKFDPVIPFIKGHHSK